MTDDLQLSELGYYCGTEKYTKMPLFTTVVTDGIAYIMQNGYSWLVTDALAYIENKLKDHEFLSIKLKLDSNNKHWVIDDGNGNVLHEQKLQYTDAKKELTLFWSTNVLMLSGEY